MELPFPFDPFDPFDPFFLQFQRIGASPSGGCGALRWVGAHGERQFFGWQLKRVNGSIFRERTAGSH